VCGGICGGNSLGIAGLDVFPSPAVPLWISRNPSLSVPNLIDIGLAPILCLLEGQASHNFNLFF